MNDWFSKLGEAILGGVGGVVGQAVPEHWRRRLRERVRDVNPFEDIASNHDLLRAARIAWVTAALDVLEAVKATAPQITSGEFDASAALQFERDARQRLLEIRSQALDRRPHVGNSPIDGHLEVIMRGTSESISPGENRALDQGVTQTFASTLAQLVGVDASRVPPLFERIATAGLPTLGGGARRSFGELVFAAFAELLKSRDRYPQAAAAFNIAMDAEARKLTGTVLECVQRIDAKLDAHVAATDALVIFRIGVDTYLAHLPALLTGQARAEALLIVVRDDVRAIRDGVDQLRAEMATLAAFLRSTRSGAMASEHAPQAIARAQYQRFVEHLAAGEFDEVLSAEPPLSFDAYRAKLIARWSQPRYEVDKRFTPLSLLIDQGAANEGERYVRHTEPLYDMRQVLDAVKQEKEAPRVLVITGAPGSGKSTVLRRLEYDLARDALRDGASEKPLTILLPLNAFGQRAAAVPDPETWIAEQWAAMAPRLPKFETLLGEPLVLLLDGLNEMPHGDRADYQAGLDAWRRFLDRLVLNHPHARAVFTCRTLDYGSRLATKDMARVPQVEILPLTPAQVRNYLEKYSPVHWQSLWRQLDGTPQLDLYSSPYYLKLLIDQAGDTGRIPAGRAALFTGFVRARLQREIDGSNPVFDSGPIFEQRDRERMVRYRGAYELPMRGHLFRGLAAFAFGLQQRASSREKSQVRIDYDAALDNELTGVPTQQREPLIKAAIDLQIVERQGDDLLFVHQLLQEYFAARHVAASCAAESEDMSRLTALARVARRVDEIAPSVAEELRALPKSGSLPALDTSGWEETFSLAAAMLPAADAFVQALGAFNLPLAGRLAAQTDVTLAEHVRVNLRAELVGRTRDPGTDLRARITAGLALGTLGDPRFTRLEGDHGSYLLGPLVDIEGGEYEIGSDEGHYEDEVPVHRVHIAPFALGRFPVTNAEFACFIDAGGYRDERWWQTPAAQRWHRGEGTADGIKQAWREYREYFKQHSDQLNQIAEEQAWSDEFLEQWRNFCAMTDDEFDAELARRFRDEPFKQPQYWSDPAFNAPSQPVVGICWYEALAYCAWLAAQTGRLYRMPSEAEWEAAARGRERRRFAYANEFDPARCNALETKLRRTTPIGVFPSGDTPAGSGEEGLADMTGNVWEWTSSVYLDYPYDPHDGREAWDRDGRRVLRGGAFDVSSGDCRCASRGRDVPDGRGPYVGFRLCCAPPIVKR